MIQIFLIHPLVLPVIDNKGEQVGTTSVSTITHTTSLVETTKLSQKIKDSFSKDRIDYTYWDRIDFHLNENSIGIVKQYEVNGEWKELIVTIPTSNVISTVKYEKD